MTPDVSIIILNYRSKNLIKEQLKFFFSKKTQSSVEVIVVDNNSADGIGDMLREFSPQVRFLQTGENRGYAAGNNVGMAAAKGRYFLIVNPDIVLTASAVDSLVDFMERRPQVGMAGPKLINADGTLQQSCLRFPTWQLPLMRRSFLARTKWGKRWLARYFMEEWDHQSVRDVDWLFGACLIVRRSAVDTAGPLDERFFLYLEDTDWCWRFWKNGYGVYYVPSVQVIHLLRRSSEGSTFTIAVNPMARIHLASFLKYLLKHRGEPSPHHN